MRARVQEFAHANWLFWLTVVFPTAVAIVYFGFLASDVYVSESQFVVRTPEKQTTSGLGVLLRSTGFSRGGDEVYAAQEYVRSRDALRDLNRNGAVRRAYGSETISIFDRFNPLGFSGTFEDLYDYYLGKVDIQYDTTSSISRLTVRAFTPDDAYRFDRELLERSEALVNRINDRGRNDVVQFAAQEVQAAKAAARTASLNLAQFRNSHGVVDPEEQARVQLETVSKLQDELVSTRMQLLQLRKIAPENPQVPVLATRAQGLANEIDTQMGRVAGGRRSLSQTAVQYERLDLERQFADKRVAAALTALQEAQSEAHRKQAYVERIVQPSRPDRAAEPRRIRSILATFILGLVAWGISSMLLAGIREHRG